MLKTLLILGAFAAVGAALADVRQAGKPQARSIHDIVVKDVKGRDVVLSKYRGNVCLIVNVASK